MKNKLFIIFFISCLSIIVSFKTDPQNSKLSGTWVLNSSKSDFGDSPTFVLPKRLEIADTKTNVKVKFTASTPAGTDTVFSYTFIQGRKLDNLTPEKRTQHFQFSRAENGLRIELEHSSSFSGKPDTEEYHTVQRFQLSPDGKELTLEKQVKIYNGETYAVKGVYEKQ